MKEGMRAFIQKIEKDENAGARCAQINRMSRKEAVEATIAWAKEMGIELTQADLPLSGEVMDENDLNQINGGGYRSDLLKKLMIIC